MTRSVVGTTRSGDLRVARGGRLFVACGTVLDVAAKVLDVISKAFCRAATAKGCERQEDQCGQHDGDRNGARGESGGSQRTAVARNGVHLHGSLCVGCCVRGVTGPRSVSRREQVRLAQAVCLSSHLDEPASARGLGLNRIGTEDFRPPVPAAGTRRAGAAEAEDAVPSGSITCETPPPRLVPTRHGLRLSPGSRSGSTCP